MGQLGQQKKNSCHCRMMPAVQQQAIALGPCHYASEERLGNIASDLFNPSGKATKSCSPIFCSTWLQQWTTKTVSLIFSSHGKPFIFYFKSSMVTLLICKGVNTFQNKSLCLIAYKHSKFYHLGWNFPCWVLHENDLLSFLPSLKASTQVPQVFPRLRKTTLFYSFSLK